MTITQWIHIRRVSRTSTTAILQKIIFDGNSLKLSFVADISVMSSGVLECIHTGRQCLPDALCAVVTVSSCERTDEGVAQRDTDRLAGLELKHKVISVRPLVGALGRCRSNSSAASRSTALYLQ